MTCPSCGQPLPVDVSYDPKSATLSANGKAARLSPTMATMVGLMVNAGREYVPTDRFIMALWPENEPDTVLDTLRVHFSLLRRRIKPLGLGVEYSTWVPGRRLVMA